MCAAVERGEKRFARNSTLFSGFRSGRLGFLPQISYYCISTHERNDTMKKPHKDNVEIQFTIVNWVFVANMILFALSTNQSLEFFSWWGILIVNVTYALYFIRWMIKR